jgi:hypothetical protein
MQHLLFPAVLAALAAATAPALAADVGVSVSIGQPGFYGRLDIGGFPQPQVIYRRPIAVERVPASRPPVYLRVPPDHAKHWRAHCREYNACGERVFFVRDNWYNREYAPRYQEQHRARRDDRRDGQRGDHRGGKNDRRGDDHDRGRNH